MPFQQTPLFQLNLMLSLTLYPSSRYQNSVFKDSGFSVFLIGYPIPTSGTKAAGLLAQPPIEANGTAAPDLLLCNDKNLKLLLLECKLSGFGPSAEQAKQANAILSCSGTYLTSLFGPTLAGKYRTPGAAGWDSFVLYVVGDGRQDDMYDTLAVLASALNLANVSVAPFGSVGIAIRSDAMYLDLESRTVIPAATLQGSSNRSVWVMKLDDNEDPTPLYIIPVDPSVGFGNPNERAILDEYVRSTLGSLIGSQLEGQSFDVSVEQVLRDAIIVWDEWADASKAHLLRVVKVYMRRVYQQLNTIISQNNLAMNVEFDHHGGRIIFRSVNPSAAERIRRYLASTDFLQEPIYRDTVQDSLL